MLKRLVLLTFLLAITGLVFGADVGDPATPVTDVSGDGEAEVLSDGGGDTPGDPAHSMSEAVNIYIHVILRQPDGPPPPDLEIIETDCTEGGELVNLKTSVSPSSPGEPSDWFDVWRRPGWPMYRISDLDTATMLLTADPTTRMTTSNYFFDYFTAGLWTAHGSKGVCDPDVNYYYVVTGVDSNETTEEVTSSPFPSNCVAEYDQLLAVSTAGNFNVISYPVDHGFSDAVDLVGDIPTATFFRKFVPSTQTWVNRAMKVGASWIPLGDVSVDVGGVYGVVLDGTQPTVLFSTYSLGHIAEPGASSILFSFPGGWEGLAENWMMAPMSYSYELKEAVAPLRDLYFRDYGEDIGSGVTTAIRVWVASSQTAVNKAIYVVGPGWILNNPVLPGQPMSIMTTTSTSTPWPPTS